jgi:hypothetical protein
MGVAVLAALANVVLAAQPMAEAALASPAAAPIASFPAWDHFTEELRQAGIRVIAKLPERLRNNPQIQQEVGRLLLEATAARTLEAISADGNHPDQRHLRDHRPVQQPQQSQRRDTGTLDGLQPQSDSDRTQGRAGRCSPGIAGGNASRDGGQARASDSRAALASAAAAALVN